MAKHRGVFCLVGDLSLLDQARILHLPIAVNRISVLGRALMHVVGEKAKSEAPHKAAADIIVSESRTVAQPIADQPKRLLFTLRRPRQDAMIDDFQLVGRLAQLVGMR